MNVQRMDACVCVCKQSVETGVKEEGIWFTNFLLRFCFFNYKVTLVDKFAFVGSSQKRYVKSKSRKVIS